MVQDMDNPGSYKDFTNRLKVLVRKNPSLITTTLSNIFTMRLIGNKTHGDLAEIAIMISVQYMYMSAKTFTAPSQKRKTSQ